MSFISFEKHSHHLGTYSRFKEHIVHEGKRRQKEVHEVEGKEILLGFVRLHVAIFAMICHKISSYEFLWDIVKVVHCWK